MAKQFMRTSPTVVSFPFLLLLILSVCSGVTISMARNDPTPTTALLADTPEENATETTWSARKDVSQTQNYSECEDINTASASMLQQVKGVGRAKAQDIINYRNQHGPFQSLDELTQVKGIGPATVENFRKASFCVRDETNEQRNDQPSPSENNPAAPAIDCKNDINTANVSDLRQVKGIGAAKAQAIINYHKQHGPFQSLDELAQVKGIGPATVENFRDAGFCVQEKVNTNKKSETQSETPANISTTTNQNCIDINSADVATLQRVKGIGFAKAQTIIDYREQHGSFESLDDLIKIRGIGKATLENFRRANFCVHASNNTGEHVGEHSYAAIHDSTSSIIACENINTADASTLQRVHGIGPVRAQAIVGYRNQNGPFTTLDGLLDVREIPSDIFSNFQKSGFCVDTLNATADSTNFLTNQPDTSSVRTSPLPYHRSLYGGWMDVDDDCQNTRHEILIAESRTDASLDETGCFVIAGEWHDPYLDTLITDPGRIDIDHFIPLSEAYRSGSATWDDSTRYSFGNDLSENGMLIPVSFTANRSKGNRDPANWLPPDTTYHCQYIDRWVTLKKTWNLTMDYAERKTVMDIQNHCSSNIEVP